MWRGSGPAGVQQIVFLRGSMESIRCTPHTSERAYGRSTSEHGQVYCPTARTRLKGWRICDVSALYSGMGSDGSLLPSLISHAVSQPRVSYGSATFKRIILNNVLLESRSYCNSPNYIKKKDKRKTKTPFSYVILTSGTNLDLFHLTNHT